MIYHVYANRSNIGDWVSAKGIQELLSPAAITECFCDGPFVKDTIKRLSKASDKDLIIIGGGGLLMDYFEPFWRSFDAIAERIPFCLWGVGYCDLKRTPTLMPKALIQGIVKKSKLTVVRDELSRSYIDDAELPPPVACPSINFVRQGKQPGKGVMHIVNYGTAGADVYETMHETAKKFAADSGRTYYETNHRIPNHSEAHLAEILRHYEQSDIVISSALHGCIIGVAMGLKVIAVSGDRKIDAFMQAVGLQEWLLDINEIALLPEKVGKLDAQTPPVAELENIRKSNHQIGEKIKKLYEQEAGVRYNIQGVH